MLSLVGVGNRNVGQERPPVEIISMQNFVNVGEVVQKLKPGADRHTHQTHAALCSRKSDSLSPSPHITGMMKSKTAGDGLRTTTHRNAYVPVGKPEDQNHLKHPEADWRLILKRILRKYAGRCGPN
jgi:hypothetical protein